MLRKFYQREIAEAGCDEAGRGCLAGPVFAAAVVLKANRRIAGLDDSKKLSPGRRLELREEIQQKALSWSVAQVSHEEIDRINILNASFKAMHLAISQLHIQPRLLLIDGNRFNPYAGLSHVCIIEGDAIYQSIAAASILAKTYRDEFMLSLHQHHPQYSWDSNKGYATLAHRKAISLHGTCAYHRKSFSMGIEQFELDFSGKGL